MGNVEPAPEEMVLTTVWLQKSLNKLGANIEVDGIPGNQTREAVKLFQKAVGIDQDGLVGPTTLDRLNKALADGKILILPDAPEIKLPPPGAEKPDNLAPTFWGRVWALFQKKG
jgi:peptidoglycan hydrolase-like protein with peptidoglycan-binding domain